MTVLQLCARATHVVLAVFFVIHDVHPVVAVRAVDEGPKTIVLDFDQTLAEANVLGEIEKNRPKKEGERQTGDHGTNEQLQYECFMNLEKPAEMAEHWLGGPDRVRNLHTVFQLAQDSGWQLAVVSKGMRLVSC